ncbi:membrane dipeptidase [Gordonia phthalatica]|uniref:Sphingolipid ceramide N-deacylase n=1 Tax=Gordonia phthalatica TaxID=1136941 RepID=A0A0N9NBK2_9ACTN|nr:membrane dipeptidase [Gordonia phthalatica]ALG84397.1 sphingolipid ceramide N-deacylase [Gordonia phthalatica]
MTVAVLRSARNLLVAATTVVALLTAPTAASSADTVPGSPAYDLAGACVHLTDVAGRPLVGRGPSSVKAAGLGEFLFYDTAGTVLTERDGTITRTRRPTPAAVWTVTRIGQSYRMATPGGRTRSVRLSPATGCRTFPEAELNVTGAPHSGTDANGNLAGFADSHAHLMAYQFLGGRIHCGKPFSPLGVTDALQDCPDHRPDGWPAVGEQILSEPGPHDTRGWPTFGGWPRWNSLTHEQTYYRWLERAWRSGLRVLNNYFVQNRVLCEIYPLNDQPCNEMESVRIQHRMLLDLRDYIDAQAGGPGRGFLRLATDEAQLRRIVESGKLAVTMGIEISEPFGCGQANGRALCTTGDIDRGMDELRRLGVRQVILTHKFDNALGGARMDSDLTGIGVEIGQVYAGGGLWRTQACRNGLSDNTPPLGAPGQCNVRGLTGLGEYAVNAAVDRRMVIDVDHLSAKSSTRVLDLLAARHYPGVVSSHDWTDAKNYRRILAAGGAVGLYAQGPLPARGDNHRSSFLANWRTVRAAARPGSFLGIGYGPDMNGLGKQAPPLSTTSSRPVTYPFVMPDGTRVGRQRTGTRVFDVNVDGTAHYGMIPDWIESLRVAAGKDGDAVVGDLYRGAEAYARLWGRVEAYRR